MTTPIETRYHYDQASVLTSVLPLPPDLDKLHRGLEPTFMQAMNLHGNEETLTTLERGVALDSHIFPSPEYAALLETPMSRTHAKITYGVAPEARTIHEAVIELRNSANNNLNLLRISQDDDGDYLLGLEQTRSDGSLINPQEVDAAGMPDGLSLDDHLTKQLLDELLFQSGLPPAEISKLPQISDKIQSLIEQAKKHQTTNAALYYWSDPEYGETSARIRRLQRHVGLVSLSELELTIQTERELALSAGLLRTSLSVAIGSVSIPPHIHFNAGIINTSTNQLGMAERNALFDNLLKQHRTGAALKGRLSRIANFLAIPDLDVAEIVDEGYESPQLLDPHSTSE